MEWTIAGFDLSELARGHQSRWFGIDAGEMILGGAGGAAQDGAESADGGQGLTGLLGLP